MALQELTQVVSQQQLIQTLRQRLVVLEQHANDVHVLNDEFVLVVTLDADDFLNFSQISLFFQIVLRLDLLLTLQRAVDVTGEFVVYLSNLLL